MAKLSALAPPSINCGPTILSRLYQKFVGYILQPPEPRPIASSRRYIFELLAKMDASNQTSAIGSLLRGLEVLVIEGRLSELGLSQFWSCLLSTYSTEVHPGPVDIHKLREVLAANVCTQLLESYRDNDPKLYETKAALIHAISDCIPQLSSRGGLSLEIIQTLFKVAPSQALCIVYQLNSNFKAHDPSTELVPWGLVLQRLVVTCQSSSQQPGDLPTGYHLVSPLLYTLGRAAFSDFLRKATKFLAVTQDANSFPLKRNNLGYLLIHLTDPEAASLLNPTDEQKSELLLEVVSYLQECISPKHMHRFSPTELEWLVYWESSEVDKFPPLHDPQEAGMKDFGEVRNPFPIFKRGRPQNESFAKLLSIFIARHLKMNSFTTDGEGCATIEGVSSVVATVASRLAKAQEPFDSIPIDWILSVFGAISHLDRCRSKVSQSLTMAFKAAMIELNPQQVVCILFLSWVHHSLEEFPGTQYGTWLKQSLQTVSSRFSSTPRLLEILALSFNTLIVEVPLHLIAEHVKLVMYTPTIAQQQFAQFRKEALASIKKMLQDAEQSISLEELLAKGGSADVLTPLEAVVLFQKAGSQALPQRLLSESMFHPTWFQSQFIPALLHSTDPKMMELAQVRNELVNMLFSAGKIPGPAYRKFHAHSSSDPPAKRQKKVAFDGDSFVASLLDLEGELEDIHESLANSHRGIEFTGRLVQQQMSIESKFLAMASKLEHLTRGSRPGTRLLRLTEVELDKTGHYLTCKPSFKSMCCGLPEDVSNPACSGPKAAHVFLSFFVSLAQIISKHPQSSRLVFERIALMVMNHPILGLALYTCAMSWIYQLASAPHSVLDARWQAKVDFDLGEAFGKILAELDWLTYEPNYNSRFLFKLPPKAAAVEPHLSLCPLLIMSDPAKSGISWPSVLIHEILCWRLPVAKASKYVFKLLDSFASHRQQQTPPGGSLPASLKASTTLVEYLRAFPSLSSNELTSVFNQPYIPFPVWVHLERDHYHCKPNTRDPIDDAGFLFSYFKDRYLSTSGVDTTNEGVLLSALNAKLAEAKKLLHANTVYTSRGLVCATENHAPLYESSKSTHMSVPFFCGANEIPIPQPKGLSSLLECLDV